MKRTWLAAAAIISLGLAACSSADTTVPETTTLETTTEPATSTTDEGVLPEGFSTALVEITEASGEVCEVCVWLADSADELGQGLMGVTSLGTAKGMAFVWGQPTAGSFFMFQTVTPLSIAWFGADGALVSTADMNPCVGEDSAACERFPAGGEFVLAIEVFQGDLASIGITDGATARLVPGSEALDCPLTDG